MRSSATLKPRLTLVTHVDWGHIRQRPQQLAASLAADYEVRVLAPLARRRSGLQGNAIERVRVRRVLRFPGSYRSARIFGLNAVAARAQCARAVAAADVVVVTSPELFDWLGRGMGSRTLVYDCPDDALAFAQAPAVREAKAGIERRLLARADLIACASEELARRMHERGAAADRTIVVRNGWDPVAFPVQPSRPLPVSGPLSLAYFGTIAPWLDFAALQAAIADAGPLAIRLVGPQDQVRLPALPGLSIEPPVAHGALAAAVAGVDCMLLPFKPDPLVRAVDPVKLYEYIALGKPILSAWWPALEPFARFVTFYRDTSELVALLQQRRVATPPPAQDRAAFLEPQSWRARAAMLHRAIAAARARPAKLP